MPEHVHLLVLPSDEQANVSLLLARIKQPFSKEIKQILTEHQSNLLDSLTVRDVLASNAFDFGKKVQGLTATFFMPMQSKRRSITST